MLKVVPSRVPKGCLVFPSARKLGGALMEEIRVSDELRSGMSHRAGGREFNVSESATY